MMVMMAHGFNTGGLFLCVGVIYERAHTRLIANFGGLASRMPVYSVLFGLFMLASIGLPGLSGFVGEFLVALAVWEYNPWLAFFTFVVVIFAAWYMMWMFQRVVFGRASGQAPDHGDTELTDAERAELAAHGGHGAGTEHGTYDTHEGGTLQPQPISGGDHGHDSPDDHGTRAGTGSYATHEGQLDSSRWPDLTRKEALTLFPLAALTIVFGVYPKPLLEIVEPSFQAILDGALRVVGN